MKSHTLRRATHGDLHMQTLPPRDSLRRRRGAAMVETAVVLTVLLTLIFGTLDLALAVRQYNAVADAARQVTREAIVRGEYAGPRKSPWGPTTYVGTAADDHDISRAVLAAIVGMEPSDVNIKVEWPDGTNAIGKRVRCTVSTTYQPIITRLALTTDVPLTATSTTLIAH